jgi:thiol-disulfide isomerase/thioredoxin
MAQKSYVGYQLKNFRSGSVLNYPKKDISVYDFKKKLILLEFWNTGCHACLSSFAKIDSLQKKYGEFLQIVLINRESKDSTIRFLRKHPKVPFPQVPAITNAVAFWKLFPHSSDPRVVWLDSTYTVKYVSDAFTEERIKAFIAGKKLAMHDPFLDTVRFGSMLQFSDSNWEKNVGYFSSITRCIKGLDVQNMQNFHFRNGASVYISNNCASVVELYKRAFEENGKYDFSAASTIIRLFPDSLYFERITNEDEREEWLQNYSYNYELLVPHFQKERVFQIMQEDLKRYFHLDARVEKRKLPCLILVRTDTTHTFFSFKRNASDHASPDSIYFLNRKFDRVTTSLKARIEYYLGQPFVDESGISEKVNMVFSRASLDPMDLDLLRKDLRNYGLDLAEGERATDVLVLRK